MKRVFSVGMTMLILGGVAGLRAEVTNDAQFAGIAQATNIAELVVLEEELDARTRVLSTQLYQVLSRIRDTRERVMNQDSELRALNRKIAALQEQIDAMLVKKYSELAAWESERDKLLDEHEKIRAGVLAIRKRKIELFNAEARSQNSNPAREANESETETENRE